MKNTKITIGLIINNFVAPSWAPAMIRSEEGIVLELFQRLVSGIIFYLFHAKSAASSLNNIYNILQSWIYIDTHCKYSIYTIKN